MALSEVAVVCVVQHTWTISECPPLESVITESVLQSHPDCSLLIRQQEWLTMLVLIPIWM